MFPQVLEVAGLPLLPEILQYILHPLPSHNELIRQIGDLGQIAVGRLDWNAGSVPAEEMSGGQHTITDA